MTIGFDDRFSENFLDADRKKTGGSNFFGLRVSAKRDFIAGDKIEVSASQDSGGSVNTVATRFTTWLRVERIDV
ncbi:hypothetical protein HFTV1-gp32 [Haloferax tailed virus 1]|uniref:Uncharacterized protein n=1 Tax=Haloferax tailed virus 1 TaxID=2507575 RepID=A0A410N717_HFTV1|nr:hypothetical protein M1M17_gp32 [Haloferax tailed virus 1]QAS68865.1 hypothetical protein HFTV1-gp32 [Haloferax tailed virus 1]